MTISAATRLPSLILADNDTALCRSEASIRAEEAPDETLLLRVRDSAGSNDAQIETASAINREALTILFRRYARLVRAVAYRILRDAAEADDLLQEVFLFIQRKCDTFDAAKSSARSWIVHLAYERAIDRRRYLNTRHFYTNVEIDDAVADLPDPRFQLAVRETALDAALAKEQLQEALAALSVDQQATLRLYFFEGYTLTEIAERLAQPLGNVRNHYYRGLEKLRQRFFAKKLRGA